MGAALLGACLLILGQSGRRARGILIGCAIALALSLLFWVRNDFGMGAVALGALACLVLGRFAGEQVSLLVVNFVAAQACVNAVLDIRVLFRPQLVINGEVVGVSDAHNMAAATFSSHWMWAGVWLVWSFTCFFVALRVIYVRQRAAKRRTARARAAAEAKEAQAPAAVTPTPLVLATEAPPGGSDCSDPGRGPA
jgi:hypothetical protein